MSYSKLESIFKELQNALGSSSNGKEFEDYFMSMLESEGFTKINPYKKGKYIPAIFKFEYSHEDVPLITAKLEWDKIKKSILEKNSLEITKNPFKKICDKYIYQPYGSQNFPDFLVFTKNYIIPIETKFSKKTNKSIDILRPMWNSNLPKPNSIYIFGVASQKITFFIGNDILSPETRAILLEYWPDPESELSKEKQMEEKLNNLGDKNKNNFGFWPYVRKAYSNKIEKSTLYKNNKQIIESYFSDESIEREKNVLKFLKEIENS